MGGEAAKLTGDLRQLQALVDERDSLAAFLYEQEDFRRWQELADETSLLEKQIKDFAKTHSVSEVTEGNLTIKQGRSNKSYCDLSEATPEDINLLWTNGVMEVKVGKLRSAVDKGILPEEIKDRILATKEGPALARLIWAKKD